MEQIKTVELNTNILINECSNGKRNEKDIFYDISLGNRELIHQIFKYQKFNYDFCDKIACYNDGEYVIGYLRPSYEDFLTSICKFLNFDLPSDYADDGALTKMLMERVEILHNVKNIRELKASFPYIYNDLIAGRKYIDDLDELKDKTKNKYKNQYKYYYSCALKRKFESFIETQTVLYGRLVNRRSTYKDLIESKDYNSYFEKVFNIDKVALYAVYEYIKVCENTKDKFIINKYLKLIDKYISSKYDKKVSIRINGEVIDLMYIKSKVYNIREKMRDNEETIEWVLIPKNVSRTSRFAKKYSRVTLFNIGDLERLRAKGEKKNSFYEKSDYLLKVLGTTGGKSYTGFIYPNGEVILDVLYDERKPGSTVIGDAIYNIKAVDFGTLSKLDKKSLKNNPKVKCIIHSKYWEDKVRKIITSENSEEDCLEAKKLVNKLKKDV